MAQRFADFDPDRAVEVPGEEYLLQRAVADRARSYQHLVAAVVAARAAGLSWRKIGDVLGTGRPAAARMVVEAS